VDDTTLFLERLRKEQAIFLCWDILLVGGLEHFFMVPYIGNNHPN